MSGVTDILAALELGDAGARDQLLALVYDELRAVAAQQLASEKPGQTLQATALVHEAYLRLFTTPAGAEAGAHFDSRRHFFAAAAEAMRRILVDRARRKHSIKHGGQRARVDLDEALLGVDAPAHDLVEINDVLDQLAAANARAAEVVKLRFFAGLTGDEAAGVLGVSPRSADLLWTYARAWLFDKLRHDRE